MQNQFSTLKRSMFDGGSHFPSLKGKAAEIRALLGPMLSACEKFLGHNTLQKRQIKLMLQCAIKMESLLDEHQTKYKLPDTAAIEFKKAAMAFVQLNTALGQHFHLHQDVPMRQKLLFNHTIKFHYLVHLGLLAAHLNPRLTWCYSGEDLMMKVKRVVQSCHRGLPGHMIPKKAMHKYAYGLGMSLQGRAWKR